MSELNQEMLPDEILDPLYEARGRWERKEWLITPRVMRECGIDLALDAMNEHLKAVEEFERVFGRD